MENLENKIPPPVLVFIMGILMWALAQFFPSTASAVAWRYPLIIIFSCIGLVFAVPAFIAFWRAKTTINPVNIQAASVLVTTGIY